MKACLPECFQGLRNFEADRLLPRESAEYVVQHSSGQISIEPKAVTDMANSLLQKYRNNEVKKLVDFSGHEMHPHTTDKSAAEWVFLTDTINFSFWTEEEEKFRVTYKGATYTGYFGACACVNRAIDSGIPLTDASYMKNITVDEVRKIFRSDDGDCMTLCERRAEVIAEAGKVLLEKFNGSFYHCLELCQKSAMKLLAMVTENFSSYRDYAVYKGQKISFLKRAQILVGDIHGCLHEKDPLADFYDIGEITMFADYRVPQILAFYDVLKYSDDLKARLKTRKLLEPGCETEVELRAFSIQAIEDIVKRIKELRTSSDDKLPVITAVAVDNLLWYLRREKAKDVENQIDYHRVRTIYY